MSDIMEVRAVVVKGERYLRLDDVAAWLRELVSTEEVDVRNRFNEAADLLFNPEYVRRLKK